MPEEVLRRMRRFRREAEEGAVQEKAAAVGEKEKPKKAAAPKPAEKPALAAPRAALAEEKPSAQPVAAAEAAAKKPTRREQVAMLRKALEAEVQKKEIPKKEAEVMRRAAVAKAEKEPAAEAVVSGVAPGAQAPRRMEQSALGKLISGLFKGKKPAAKPAPTEKEVPRRMRERIEIRKPGEIPELEHIAAEEFEEKKKEPWLRYKPVRGAEEGRAAKLYYAAGEPQPQRKKPEEAQPTTEEISAELYAQLEKEGQLRKEGAKMALREVKGFREEHQRYPTEQEYGKIAESIYAQLKETYGKEAAAQEKRPSVAERREALRAKKPEAKEAVAAAPKPPGILAGEKIEELFKEEKKGPLELSEFAEMEGEEDEEDLRLLGFGEEEAVPKEIETARNKCPTCGTPTENLVFCSSCGEGFCTHCAKKVEVLGDRVKYVCPHCGSETKVKRKA